MGGNPKVFNFIQVYLKPTLLETTVCGFRKVKTPSYTIYFFQQILH